MGFGIASLMPFEMIVHDAAAQAEAASERS